MKRYLLLLLVLCAGCCQAATIDMKEAPESIRESIIYWSDFSQKQAVVNEMGLPIRCEGDGVARVGYDKGCHGTWCDRIGRHPSCRSQSFSVSFDLLELEGNVDSCLLSMYTEGANRNRGLILSIGKHRNLELVCHKFTNTENLGTRGKIILGKIDALTADKKTITVVYNGDANTIRAYVDGEPVGKRIKLRYDGASAKKQLYAVQLGSYYGGGAYLKRSAIDNLCFWSTALTDEQVAETVQGGIPPVVWKVLTVLGGLLLFAAQAAGFYLLGRRASTRSRSSAEEPQTYVEETSDAC